MALDAVHYSPTGLSIQRPPEHIIDYFKDSSVHAIDCFSTDTTAGHNETK